VEFGMANRPIAIITARGGSKRIPKKNIKLFLGKPIIAFVIEAAFSSKLFSDVFVSTDDHEIAEISKKYGASVPFMRSEKSSDDHATTYDVCEEFLNRYKKMYGEIASACIIYPTAVFINNQILNESYKVFETGNFDALFPVVRHSGPIQRALRIENKKVAMILPENLNKRSQDFESTYYDAGQFYWVNTKSVLEKGKIMTENSGAFEISEMEAQDIDNLIDWELAEFKFSYLKSKNGV